MMSSPGCLWNRPRLERLVDGALGPWMGRVAAQHASRCHGCGLEVERLRRLRVVLRSAGGDVTDPDWSGFWPAVRARIAREAPAPVRDPWWLPYWKPVWGHPRVALSGLVISGLATALVFWPSVHAPVSRAVASPVEVQDVSTPDPNRSVMVFSNPDDDVTVIWVFNSAEQDEES